MKTKYIDLIEQTFDFPQKEFDLVDNQLNFHGVDLSELIATYGAPLKFTYLPKFQKTSIDRIPGLRMPWPNTIIKENTIIVTAQKARILNLF